MDGDAGTGRTTTGLCRKKLHTSFPGFLDRDNSSMQFLQTHELCTFLGSGWFAGLWQARDPGGQNWEIAKAHCWTNDSDL